MTPWVSNCNQSVIVLPPIDKHSHFFPVVSFFLVSHCFKIHEQRPAPTCFLTPSGRAQVNTRPGPGNNSCVISLEANQTRRCVPRGWGPAVSCSRALGKKIFPFHAKCLEMDVFNWILHHRFLVFYCCFFSSLNSTDFRKWWMQRHFTVVSNILTSSGY